MALLLYNARTSILPLLDDHPILRLPDPLTNTSRLGLGGDIEVRDVVKARL